MSIFSAIMDKIFHNAKAPAVEAAGNTAAPLATPQPVVNVAPLVSPAPAESPATAAPVDVEAVLAALATEKGGGGNWRGSIVDLLKLLDLDSSLTARKTLAEELNVHVAEPGSAEENVALHQAVMKKLEENGGVVPDRLKG